MGRVILWLGPILSLNLFGVFDPEPWDIGGFNPSHQLGDTAFFEAFFYRGGGFPLENVFSPGLGFSWDPLSHISGARFLEFLRVKLWV